MSWYMKQKYYFTLDMYISVWFVFLQVWLRCHQFSLSNRTLYVFRVGTCILTLLPAHNGLNNYFLFQPHISCSYIQQSHVCYHLRYLHDSHGILSSWKPEIWSCLQCHNRHTTFNENPSGCSNVIRVRIYMNVHADAREYPASRSGWFTPRKSPRYPLDMDLGGPHSRHGPSDQEKKKSLVSSANRNTILPSPNRVM